MKLSNRLRNLRDGSFSEGHADSSADLESEPSPALPTPRSNPGAKASDGWPGRSAPGNDAADSGNSKLAPADHSPPEPDASLPLPLFRTEVAERNWEILASRGLLPKPPRGTVFAIIGFALVLIAAAAFIARGWLPRVEFAHGYLEPDGGVARVRASRQGVISTVFVKDGQAVSRGDPLVTLQSAQTTESGAVAEAEIAAQLKSQRDDLKAQIAREDDWRRDEEHRLSAISDELAQDCELIELSLETQRQQLDLAQQSAGRVRELAERGGITAEELTRRQIAALGQRLALQNSERELASRRAQSAVARIAMAQLPTTAGERLRGLREGLANVQQRLIELDTRQAVIVRAPIDGRVAALPAIVGGAVDVGSLVATIVPEQGKLSARLFVATGAIGKVRRGQTVTIRYQAFPYQKYGTFKGRVEDVSNSVLLPEDVAKLSPIRLTEPAYVLDVPIEQQSVAIGDDRRTALRPDMLLTATIEVDREPLLAWIGESVFGVAQR